LQDLLPRDLGMVEELGELFRLEAARRGA